jgi:hypothetical protein
LEAGETLEVTTGGLIVVEEDVADVEELVAEAVDVNSAGKGSPG